MNYVSVENISKSYGERVLFEDISFGINKDQKIAFVAKNGSGKTSILNIIAGLDTTDTGQVVSRKDIHTAYLAQNMELNPNLTIEETIFSTDNKILSVVTQYEKALLNPDDSDAYQAAFDLMDVERLEVLKGPQGTLYGRNATSGAIKVVSKEPSEEFGGSISTKIGNYDLRTVKLILDTPLIEDKLLMRSAFVRTKRDG